MNRIDNIMILASAGSGKTYALTNRFVRLLALGAKPERIVALTFTRKAAGEFFDEILKKLSRGAREADYAAQLAHEIEQPNIGPPVFLRMLREVIDAMHQLQLGTFDGFFARIASNFPLELGLAGEFEILEEHSARIERARVLRKLFKRTGELATEQREFIEAFKRATFGAQEKRLGAELDAFLDEHHEIFLAVPHSDYWGNPERIWREGAVWTGGKGRPADWLQVLNAWVATTNPLEKQRLRWMEFINAWSAWSPGVVPERPLVYVLEKALAQWEELKLGRAVLEFDRKKQELSPAACGALVELTQHIIASEIARRVEITRGIHAVLAGYESVYDDAVRRAGKLTFGDVQRLLQPGRSNANVLSQIAGEEGRLFIDFRLDAKIDHWLLDEFQDTSFGQWSVLKNLIDEALQDPTGTRSLFYVGDVKQAIFAWREGDPRLFREIFDRYNSQQPGTILEQQLVTSWRSGPAIIDTVNQVFGNAAVLNSLFPGDASEVWAREWRTHHSGRPELVGQVALLHGDDEESRFAITLSLLETVDPLARGLTCGLLVQSNAMASRLADYLRREGGFPAVADSDLHVCVDNPLGVALLSLFKAASHPGDSLAVEHVQMTPLEQVLRTVGYNGAESLTLGLLQQIHRDGFEQTASAWLRRLEQILPNLDDFSRQRGRQFIAAAALFDATGSRNTAEFIEYMEGYTQRDIDAGDVIRVMTIHKSKGLGFDLVVLPDLEGVRLDCRRDGLAVQKTSEREVEWVLDLPGKLFHSHDPVLSVHVAAAESTACYESLSLLYVAMTRAKRGMYLITKPAGKSTSRNYPKLLSETLGEQTLELPVGERRFAGSFSKGDPQWFSTVEPKRSRVTRQPIQIIGTRPTQDRQTLAAVRPSRPAFGEVLGSRLFSIGQSRATDFGNDVHRLLAEIEWVDGSTLAVKAQEWATKKIPPEAVEHVIKFLGLNSVAEMWTRHGNADVWRERSFEVILDGHWITGTFDRVVVHRDAFENPIRVEIFDFKTDRITSEDNIEEARARYFPQLSMYRRVAAVLTGLSVERTSATLVFTGTGRIAVLK